MRPATIGLTVSLFFMVVAAGDERIDFSGSYHECTTAFQRSRADIAPVLAKCEEPANQGVPGAQYALGALLVNRATGDDVAVGISWLEKASANGSIPAAYHLATVLVESTEQAVAARGRELFKSAACAGYPQAVRDLKDAGVSILSLGCSASSATEFSGDWIVSLKWDRSSASSDPTESYKLSIRGGRVNVFVKSGDEWVEAKAGKFSLSQLDQSATVAVTDSGWDFDGKWIESWTLQLMRLTADEAAVAYLRTVNNPQLPTHLSWRTFANFAEGKARRVAP